MRHTSHLLTYVAHAILPSAGIHNRICFIAGVSLPLPSSCNTMQDFILSRKHTSFVEMRTRVTADTQSQAMPATIYQGERLRVLLSILVAHSVSISP